MNTTVLKKPMIRKLWRHVADLFGVSTTWRRLSCCRETTIFHTPKFLFNNLRYFVLKCSIPAADFCKLNGQKRFLTFKYCIGSISSSSSDKCFLWFDLC